jgi:hypothetical protein
LFYFAESDARGVCADKIDRQHLIWQEAGPLN